MKKTGNYVEWVPWLQRVKSQCLIRCSTIPANREKNPTTSWNKQKATERQPKLLCLKTGYCFLFSKLHLPSLDMPMATTDNETVCGVLLHHSKPNSGVHKFSTHPAGVPGAWHNSEVTCEPQLSGALCLCMCNDTCLVCMGENPQQLC
jgi:hypothetical protein